MPEVEAQTDRQAPRVGLVRQHVTFLGGIDRIECHGLGDEEAGTVRRELMARNPWRLRFRSDAFYAELPPLVVTDPSKLAFPPPCREYFEPTPLRETDPTLQALADLIRENADPSLHKILGRKPAISSFAKSGLIAAGLLILLVSALSYWHWSQSQSMWSVLVGLLPLAGVVASLVIQYMQRKRDWFLVPGGVVVREAENHEPTTLHVLSPRTTNIRINGLQVSLRDHERGMSFSTTCTPLEIAVLLAVWQSPIPAPDVSKLVDLQ